MKYHLILIFLFLSGCTSNHALKYESAGEPEKLLVKYFGSAPLKESLNFYIESNPWNVGHERAISIKENEVYLIVAEQNEKSKFYVISKRIEINSCAGLQESIDVLNEKLNTREKDSALEKKEQSEWLDPPTYTLVVYGSDGKVINKLNGTTLLYDNREIIIQASSLIASLEKCK